MSLPDGYEELSKEDWLALATSGDAAERKQVSNCLRALGYEPPLFLSWSAEDRVEKILEHQDEGGSKKSSKSSSSKSKGSNKTKSKSTSKEASSDGGAVTVDLSEALEKIEALEGKVSEMSDAVDISMDYVREIHTMMRVFFQSDEDAKNNLEEMGNYFHGKLMGLEQEDDEEEG